MTSLWYRTDPSKEYKQKTLSNFVCTQLSELLRSSAIKQPEKANPRNTAIAPSRAACFLASLVNSQLMKQHESNKEVIASKLNAEDAKDLELLLCIEWKTREMLGQHLQSKLVVLRGTQLSRALVKEMRVTTVKEIGQMCDELNALVARDTLMKTVQQQMSNIDHPTYRGIHFASCEKIRSTWMQEWSVFVKRNSDVDNGRFKFRTVVDKKARYVDYPIEWIVSPANQKVFFEHDSTLGNIYRIPTLSRGLDVVIIHPFLHEKTGVPKEIPKTFDVVNVARSAKPFKGTLAFPTFNVNCTVNYNYAPEFSDIFQIAFHSHAAFTSWSDFAEMSVNEKGVNNSRSMFYRTEWRAPSSDVGHVISSGFWFVLTYKGIVLASSFVIDPANADEQRKAVNERVKRNLEASKKEYDKENRRLGGTHPTTKLPAIKATLPRSTDEKDDGKVTSEKLRDRTSTPPMDAIQKVRQWQEDQGMYRGMDDGGDEDANSTEDDCSDDFAFLDDDYEDQGIGYGYDGSGATFDFVPEFGFVTVSNPQTHSKKDERK